MHSAHHGPPPAAVLLSFHTAGRDRLSFGLAPFKKKTNINKTVPYTPARCEPGSFQCDRKSNAKIMNVWYKTCRHHTNFHCWYDRHTLSLKSSLCGVTELCFGTKQIHLGVITSDECKNAPRTICPSLVRHHGRWSILAYSSCTGTVDVTSHRGTSVLPASLVRGIVITGLYTRSV